MRYAVVPRRFRAPVSQLNPCHISSPSALVVAMWADSIADDKGALPKRQEHSDARHQEFTDRKSTRLNSSHSQISYAVFCLKKKKNKQTEKQTKIHIEYTQSR